VAALVALAGCAHFNTLYNAELKYDEAMDIKRTADPERDKISTQEVQLYKEAFERAARVVKYWPTSKWVDDALLIMGRASFEKGDYSTALRKYSTGSSCSIRTPSS
jgi:outer membrane protein assembly factor BamD (BamD/ComL family)